MSIFDIGQVANKTIKIIVRSASQEKHFFDSVPDKYGNLRLYVKLFVGSAKAGAFTCCIICDGKWIFGSVSFLWHGNDTVLETVITVKS